MLVWLLQYQLQVHQSINRDLLFQVLDIASHKIWLTYSFICSHQVGIYLPCYDIFRNWFEEFTAKSAPTATPYVPLVAGSLARSLACATCYPIELARTRMQVFKKNLSKIFSFILEIPRCLSHSYVSCLLNPCMSSQFMVDFSLTVAIAGLESACFIFFII